MVLCVALGPRTFDAQAFSRRVYRLGVLAVTGQSAYVILCLAPGPQSFAALAWSPRLAGWQLLASVAVCSIRRLSSSELVGLGSAAQVSRPGWLAVLRHSGDGVLGVAVWLLEYCNPRILLLGWWLVDGGCWMEDGR